MKLFYFTKIRESLFTPHIVAGVVRAASLAEAKDVFSATLTAKGVRHSVSDYQFACLDDIPTPVVGIIALTLRQ